MKLRLPIVLLTLGVFLSSSTASFAALREEPVTRFPLFDRGEYATDLFTGSATYSYSFNLPKGLQYFKKIIV